MISRKADGRWHFRLIVHFHKYSFDHVMQHLLKNSNFLDSSSNEEIYNYHLNHIQQENEGSERERP